MIYFSREQAMDFAYGIIGSIAVNSYTAAMLIIFLHSIPYLRLKTHIV